MAVKKRGTKSAKKRIANPEPANSQKGGSQTDPAVIAFLRKLDHPMK